MLSTIKLAGLQLLGTASFAVDSVDGLESPEYRINQYDKPGEDGGVVSGSYYGLRAITMNGLVTGSGSAATHETNRRALETACAVTRDSTGFPIYALLELTTLGGTNYFTYVQVKQLRNPVGRGTSSPFQISMVAPDPRLYVVGQQTTGAISRPSGGGFVLPVILPITFGSSSGGSGSATNTGNVPTYPILTLRGQLTNPYVLNSANGGLVQLNRTIASGETVVIDMGNKTVTLNGSTSLLNTRTSDSTWWSLNPGVNPISFSTGSTSDTGTLEITWYQSSMGL